MHNIFQLPFLIVRHFKHYKEKKRRKPPRHCNFSTSQTECPPGQLKNARKKIASIPFFFPLKIHVTCTRYTTVNIGNHIIPFIKPKLFNSYCS